MRFVAQSIFPKEKKNVNKYICHLKNVPLFYCKKHNGFEEGFFFSTAQWYSTQ